MQLRYFLAVCEFGKIRIASEHLHVSEPAVSVSIKRLEDELGFTLFLRDRKQLLLTDDGKRLRDGAAEVVERFDHLERELRKPGKKAHVICIGVPSGLSEFIFSPLFTAFMEQNPSVLFDFLPLPSHEAAQQVADERIELAICDRMAVDSPQLTFVPIICSQLLGCVSQHHPLADSERVTPQMLRGSKLIFLNEKAVLTQQILRWFRDGGVEPDLFMYSNRTSFTVSMLKRHDAVAFFLDAVFETPQVKQENFASFTLSPPLHFINGVARKTDKKLSAEAQAFFDFCCKNRLRL